MATTASQLQNSRGVSLFYMLQVTGIPYKFFSVIDPTNASRYGLAAWTLAAGYTAAQGMDLPSDNLEQKMPDIIGGIASPERIRISLRDFKVSSATGPQLFFSRLFSPGRMSLAAPIPELASVIGATDGAADTFDVTLAGPGATIGGSTPWVAHVGGEAIRIAAPVVADSNGNATLTISARNLYPCAPGYPATPYHYVISDENGSAIAGRNQLVASEPYTLLGRKAALYVGHMTGPKSPCTEAEMMLRLIGRISSMDTGENGGEYEIVIDSIMGDMERAQVAPALSVTEISPNQLDVQGDYCFLTFGLNAGNDIAVGSERSSYEVPVPAGMYTIEQLVAEIDFQILTMSLASTGLHGDLSWGPRFELKDIDGQLKAVFYAYGSNSQLVTMYVRNGRKAQQFTGNTGNDARVGLLSVLGFDDTGARLSSLGSVPDTIYSGGPIQAPRIVADHPAPSVFIAFNGASSPFAVNRDASTFFTDQGDGGAVAYVRFSDGQLAQLTDATATTLTVSTQPSFSVFGSPKPASNSTGANGYFRVDSGQTATVEQVVLVPPSPSVASDPANLIGRFLASTGQQSGDLDVYPQGVGLALEPILDSASILRLPDDGIPRAVVVDSRTNLAELFTPIAKEYGAVLVWDPLLAQVSLRLIRVPSAALATNIDLSESNRSEVGDRTRMIVDQSTMRSAWTLKWGWDRKEEKFMGNPITLKDAYVISAYGASVKGEIIEDKTIVFAGATPGMLVVEQVFSRSYLYRQPWMKCRRTITKAGLLLAPGSAHQIIDNTAVNPFTGARGITAADRIFGLLTSVSINPSTGKGIVEFVVNKQDPSSVFRVLSPCALVDFAATGHGYNNATGVLTLKSHYASDGVSFDGVDFAVGDTVGLVSRDADSTPSYQQVTTITAIAVDGHTVNVAAGLGAFPATTEVVMILREYAASTAARKAEVAYQGDVSGQIDSTTVNHRWL